MTSQQRASSHPWLAALVAAAVLTMPTSAPLAQGGYLHYNTVVEKLVEGKHVFGVSTSDLSRQNALSLAGNENIDYVYLDMEHNPLRFEEMQQFVANIVAGNKHRMIKRGDGQIRPNVFARFPPWGHEQTLWMVKHALDMGLSGILINNLETKEQAEAIVSAMRPVQPRDSKIPMPIGLRGGGGCPWWGPQGNCRERADLWPLNPQGDLIFWPMIETMEGVKNADAIAQTPGVSGFYLGAAGDLSASLGVPNTHADVEAAMQKILSVCQARNIACGGTVTPANAALRAKQGYRIFNFGGANGGMTSANEAARQAVVVTGAKR